MRTSLKFAHAFFFATVVSFGIYSGAETLHFISPTAIDLGALPAPPALGTPTATADLAQVLSYQQSRTAGLCARAQREAPLTLEAIFGAPYGPLDAAEIQATQILYWALFQDMDHFTHLFKAHWQRPRPYLESAAVKPCLGLETSSSYPSGHAAIARLEALVLGQIFPAKAADLVKRADEVALDRVIGGVHHPLDIQAGQHLADLVYDKMQTNPQFIDVVQRLKSGAHGQNH